MKTSLIVMLLMFGTPAFVSLAAGRHDESREYDLKKYEISAGGALYPGQAAFGYDFATLFAGHSIPDIYMESSYRTQYFSCGSWNVAFTYNFTRLFALEVDVAYERGWEKVYSKADAVGYPDRGMEHDVLEMTGSRNYITPMAAFKIHWLNRKTVRMYSSFGTGVSICIGKEGDIGHPGLETLSLSVSPAFQLNPVGITVGRGIYGFAEAGIGNVFCGGRVGIGCRF
ncbi:MAG: hypothetical protein IAB80_02960 [Bacteroidetes bacterium]|uniref:Outer membrane protein beta-barrel domain-containing protein n=1 Tax=Candidatus Cryptobacteroides excrementipullorum TaxID=2840761 RepID=A0A9D9IT39_9BACT|nr:hypothetical protein [Candidatus Cryptobacteroides excrementipullorum]